MGELSSRTTRHVLDADAPARYGSGRLFFVRDSTLYAQAFDPARHELSGPVLRIADGLANTVAGAALSVSAAGPIAYRIATDQPARQLAWFDRSGKQLGVAGDQGIVVSNPALSPDGRQLLVQRTVSDNIDIWSLDLDRNVLTKLTLDPDIDALPLWSPDGQRLIFSRSGRWRIMRLDGSGEDQEITPASGAGAKVASDWSPDGRFILFKQFDTTTGGADLWVVRVDGAPSEPRPVVQTPYDEHDGQFSPDGRWIAYQSDESGRPEIYVQPFPGPGAKLRISQAGGAQVRWRRDGREIFYIASDGQLIAVPVDASTGRLTLGTAVPLFRTRLTPTRTIFRQQYVVAADGQRFLVNGTHEAAALPVTVVLNWRSTDSD